MKVLLNLTLWLVFLFFPFFIHAENLNHTKQSFDSIVKKYTDLFNSQDLPDDGSGDDAWNSLVVDYVQDVLAAKKSISKDDFDRFDIDCTEGDQSLYANLAYHGANGSSSIFLKVEQKVNKVILTYGVNSFNPETHQCDVNLHLRRVYANARVVTNMETLTPTVVNYILN